MRTPANGRCLTVVHNTEGGRAEEVALPQMYWIGGLLIYPTGRGRNSTRTRRCMSSPVLSVTFRQSQNPNARDFECDDDKRKNIYTVAKRSGNVKVLTGGPDRTPQRENEI